MSVVVTVGTSKSMGYQYNFYNTLDQISSLFDAVIIVSSTREQFTLERYRNVTLISDERSWFPEVNGVEEFQFGKLFDNTMLGLAAAAKISDTALLLSINQYVPYSQKEKLYKSAQSLVERKAPWAWMHKAYQVCDKMTYPSNRVPYLINLNVLDEIVMQPDSLIYKGKKTKIEDGFFVSPPFYIVDMLGDATKEDFDAKWDFYETKLFNYAYGHDRPRPDWDERVAYLQSKLENKVLWRGADVPEARKFAAALPGDAAAHFLKVPECDWGSLVLRLAKVRIKSVLRHVSGKFR
jgi:hypothetical protein